MASGISVGRHAVDNGGGHVVVSLMGRFKGEDGDRMHVVSLANATRSGIRIRAWLERVVGVLKKEALQNCPAFCDKDGFMLSSSDIEAVFHPILTDIQMEGRFPESLPEGLKIEDHFFCYRSFRRGAEVTSLNQGLDRKVVEFVHRWSRFEKSKGRVPGFNMLDHYADGALMRPTQILFSSSL